MGYCFYISDSCQRSYYCKNVFGHGVCPIQPNGTYYSKVKKKWLPTFEHITVGHTFSLHSEGRVPEGEKHYCDFCGGRLKRVFTVIRDDGSLFKSGYLCLQRLGLFLPEKQGKKKRCRDEERSPVEKFLEELWGRMDGPSGGTR
jgi:hypothetical protein